MTLGSLKESFVFWETPPNDIALAEEDVDSLNAMFEDNADILWSACNLEGTISRCGTIVITER